jgi:hypothetical protein
MKIGDVKIGQKVYLPVVVAASTGNSGWSYVMVQFDEGKDGMTYQQVHYTTPVVSALDLGHGLPMEKSRSLEPDDIVFITCEDGMWRVADRFKDKLFLTPYNFEGEARIADEEECYLVNGQPKEVW